MARKQYNVPVAEQVIVVIMNNARDLQIAREQGWYRIPVKSAPRWVNARYIAFYQTKIFKEEGWAIHYWSEVKSRSTVTRRELFPDEVYHQRADEKYYKLELSPLKKLSLPIISRKGRRIVFIPTTLQKFTQATEINDLFHESPLEDNLWNALKIEHVEAERQYYLTIGKKSYCLDFAVFCQNGKIDVECDGDTWHSQTERIAEDNIRNNDLEKQGWAVLRFNGRQLDEDLPGCLRYVRETANRYGGLVTSEGEVRYFAQGEEANKQLNLFQEGSAEYTIQIDSKTD